MKKTIEVTVGEKVTDDAGNKDAGVTHSKPEPASEVAGHYVRHTSVECPYCHAIVWIYEDTNVRKRFSCCVCNYTFVY